MKVKPEKKLNQKGYCQNVIYFMSQEGESIIHHKDQAAETNKSQMLLSESS